MACGVAKVMRQGCADALVTEEPYEGILHVRVCGGTGRETAGPTRQPAKARAGRQGEWLLDRAFAAEAQSVIRLEREGPWA